MKSFYYLVTMFLISLNTAWAIGFPQQLAQVRNVYSSTNVTTSAYVQLVAALPKEASAIEIFDSSGQTLEIGVGAAGSEVIYMIVFPGGNGRIPLNFLSGSRVAIKSLSATANTGEIDINFYY